MRITITNVPEKCEMRFKAITRINTNGMKDIAPKVPEMNTILLQDSSAVIMVAVPRGYLLINTMREGNPILTHIDVLEGFHCSFGLNDKKNPGVWFIENAGNEPVGFLEFREDGNGLVESDTNQFHFLSKTENPGSVQEIVMMETYSAFEALGSALEEKVYISDDEWNRIWSILCNDPDDEIISLTSFCKRVLGLEQYNVRKSLFG